ncbi:MCE family protein [Mycolicibacterium diernhoferi]|uniref:Mammalian cell entry protein n=3 Tax=Mycolicibacterium diernhoferi TaxID=1801 RepID=A0A1Q4HBV3_9MYCO|nr:mammalian cell entry protein [Mycolicibacterium diernhoferi]PEG52972.1 mammalian cell entry protein [Mycolicibacterium diernhoferi]
MTGRMPRSAVAATLLVLAVGLSGCGWRGVNSLPLPGTEGGGPGAFQVQAQLPQVTNLERNSRVRVGDVTVGNVSNIERQGWHALVTMTLNGNVELPANATVKIGQTSLLGTLHIELAPPVDEEPKGKLQNGSLIPLENDASYPTTEQTLAAVSMLFNGGGLGQVHDITRAFSTAFKGREQDMRSFLEQLNLFVGELDGQKHDIIAATDSLNAVSGQFAAQKPVVDKALQTIPDALAVINDERGDLTEAFAEFGEFSELAADAVNRSKDNVVRELDDVGPVLKSLADAGPSMTRSLSYLSTYPFPKETIENWVRGDYVNLTGIFDLTLSRIDAAMFTGTRFEGKLTELEMRWGRTIGQLPSPYTAGNPLIVPYHRNQGS